jgi:hypothetical protein
LTQFWFLNLKFFLYDLTFLWNSQVLKP